MVTVLEARAASAEAWWQHCSELLACLNTAGELVDVNPAWNGLLALEPGALRGQAWVHLLHPQDAGQASAALKSAGSGPDHPFEARCRHARGHYVGVSWSLSRASNGLLLASGRRSAPEAASVAANGAEAASARAQHVLALGRLAGGVAHDINNLLQVLRNALELVRRQPEDAAGVQRLSESALRVLDQGAQLTGQLLASSGVQRLQSSAVAVGPLLRGMRSELERRLPPQISLHMRVAPDAGSVMADPAQLQTAVLNLVLNACDAMQGLAHGGPVTLSCDRTLLAGDPELPTGEYLRLSASDVGTGMSDAVRERAFEPFFTTRPLAEGGHGRGLGLSEVHGFSRQCGGTTRILSTGPQGTTVSMLLPVLATAGGGLAKAITVGLADAPVALVMVGGQSALRQPLCDNLRLLGYRAVPVADASAILAAMQRHSGADVVLIETASPRAQDGRGHDDEGVPDAGDLARRLRVTWPQLGVVLVAGVGKPVIARPGQRILQAPFDLAALSEAVDEAIESAAPPADRGR